MDRIFLGDNRLCTSDWWTGFASSMPLIAFTGSSLSFTQFACLLGTTKLLFKKSSASLDFFAATLCIFYLHKQAKLKTLSVYLSALQCLFVHLRVFVLLYIRVLHYCFSVIISTKPLVIR
ncbi:hypothetical protein CW304_24545 [Bacillus sp. UFRGS-B20]|nr:hypothetical protein CW304_24545 [Bacillus sp. UFRGS-B20]